MQEKRREKREASIIKVLEKEKFNAKLVVTNTNPGFLNAIRRTAIAYVPTLAIEDVIFSKNDSVLYDEIIAHRLGLIPLKTNLKTFTFRDKCKCGGKGCGRCEARLVLKAKGPCTVYSGDLKSSSVKPVYDKIPITKLLEGQEFVLEAVAVLGAGNKHIKWSPCWITYQGYPIIEINTRKCNSCSECIEACPRNVFDKNEKKPVIKNLLNCHLCRACQDICERKAIIVQGSKKDFIVDIETWGQMDVKELIQTSCDVLLRKLEELNKAIK